jgi:hypothetical protein
MFYDAFTFRSLTHAQSGRDALDRQGVANWLVRAPKSLSDQGCGYLVEVRGEDGVWAASVLRAWGAPFAHIYSFYPDGRIEEAGV